MTIVTPYRSTVRESRDGFGQLLHAEWTKFRTVRGWVIGVIVAVLLTAGLGALLAKAAGPRCATQTTNGQQQAVPCVQPNYSVGPGGELVTDAFNFIRQPLDGNGSVTVRVASLATAIGGPNGPQPVLVPWSKAGIIIKDGTSQGSAYAAMMVTGGNGVRMQWNYTGDTPGLAGAVSAGSPRWLRLTRDGDTITGFDSADGTHWTQIGTVTLSGLPSTVQAGLFVTSPVYSVYSATLGSGNGSSSPTVATAVFDQVGRTGRWPAGTWTQDYVGENDMGVAQAAGRYHQVAGRFTVTGSGDIAPLIAGALNDGPNITVRDYLLGLFVGLIAMAVVATMFMTSEYRRGLIRSTLAASPNRGRVLAAKAIVIGSVAFVVGLAAAAGAVLIGTRVAHSAGVDLYPEPWPTELRIIVGMAALFAVAAVFTLAVATIVRRSAAAIIIVIVTLVIPFVLSAPPGIPAGLTDWLLRVTPAAAFALQQPAPQYYQVAANYGTGSGYFPLAPWAGFAVLCGWTVVALALAACLLRLARRVSQAAVVADGWPFADALHAEWTKLRTLASTGWLLLGIVAFTVAVSAAADAAASCPAGGCQADQAKLSLTGVQVGQAIVVVIAVLAVSNEYSTGMIRVTLAAMPRRLTVLAAKSVLVLGLVLAAAAVAVLACVLLGRLILPGHGFTLAHGYQALSPGDGPVLRAASGSALYLALIALLSLGVATAVREAAVAIGIVLALLYVFPIVSSVTGDPHWQRHLEQIGPMTAGLYIQATAGVKTLPLTPWQGLGVLAAWAFGALLLGAAVLHLRDA